jgi:hypothetical protein
LITERLFTRRPLTGALLTLIVVGALALWYRQRVAEWCDWAANVATVLGLLVSIVGFALTILTMLATQQISREAQRRIEEAARHAEEAVERAQQETRQVVERIASQHRSADRAALGRLVQDLRQAAVNAQWERAAFRAQDCHWLALRLSCDLALHAEERSELQNSAKNLIELQRFIEKNRLPGSPRGLNTSQLGYLDAVIRLLGTLEGRLLHEAMR